MNTLTTNIINLDQVEVIESPERELAPSYAGINAENFPKPQSGARSTASSPPHPCLTVGAAKMVGSSRHEHRQGSRPPQSSALTARLLAAPSSVSRRRACLMSLTSTRSPHTSGTAKLNERRWASSSTTSTRPRGTDLPQLPCVLMHGQAQATARALCCTSSPSMPASVKASALCSSPMRGSLLTSRHHGGALIDPTLLTLRTHILNNIDLLCLDELGGIGGSGSDWGDWYRDQTRELIGAIYDRWSAGELAVCYDHQPQAPR